MVPNLLCWWKPLLVGKMCLEWSNTLLLMTLWSEVFRFKKEMFFDTKGQAWTFTSLKYKYWRMAYAWV